MLCCHKLNKAQQILGTYSLSLECFVTFSWNTLYFCLCQNILYYLMGEWHSPVALVFNLLNFSTFARLALNLAPLLPTFRKGEFYWAIKEFYLRLWYSRSVELIALTAPLSQWRAICSGHLSTCKHLKSLLCKWKTSWENPIAQVLLERVTYQPQLCISALFVNAFFFFPFLCPLNNAPLKKGYAFWLSGTNCSLVKGTLWSMTCRPLDSSEYNLLNSRSDAGFLSSQSRF